MKVRLTLDLNTVEREVLKGIICRKQNIQFEDYREALRKLVKEKIQELDSSD